MKILRCAALVLAVTLFAGVARADEPSDDGQVSQETLSAIGLGEMEVMSEEESLEVRGRFALVGGFAITPGFFFPVVDGYIDAGPVFASGSADVSAFGQFAGGGSFAFGF